MYAPTGRGVTAERFVRDNLSLEEIREYCERHSTQLSGWMPESMEEVERLAARSRYFARMREWYRRSMEITSAM